MRVPSRLEPLVDQGVVEEVLRPLMSGKEADVYLVLAEGEVRVAKIYKEATTRSFKHRAEYTEGRQVRNSRQQRAMERHSRYGREQIEAAWRSAEVDAIYQLRAAGVRVPEPYAFVEGVLVMELIADEYGEPAPRLVDVDFEQEEAEALFQVLIREVVKMLCAGLVHGDLSDFNVLLSPDGPVIIDFPQTVDASLNRNARKLLVRDVQNLQDFLARHAPQLKQRRYGEEIWSIYERGQLTPDTRLTGRFEGSNRRANTSSLLEEIEAVEREARRRRGELGLPERPARAPKISARPPEPVRNAPKQQKGGGNRGQAEPRNDRRPEPRHDRRPTEPRKEAGRREPGPGRNQPRPERNAKPQEPETLTDLDSFLLIED